MILHKTLEDEIQARLEELEEIIKDAPRDVQEKFRDWLWWFKSDIIPFVEYGKEVIENIDRIAELKREIERLEGIIEDLEFDKNMLEEEIDELEANKNKLQEDIEELKEIKREEEKHE